MRGRSSRRRRPSPPTATPAAFVASRPMSRSPDAVPCSASRFLDAAGWIRLLGLLRSPEGEPLTLQGVRLAIGVEPDTFLLPPVHFLERPANSRSTAAPARAKAAPARAKAPPARATAAPARAKAAP